MTAIKEIMSSIVGLSKSDDVKTRLKELVGAETDPEKSTGLLRWVGVLPGWLNAHLTTAVTADATTNLSFLTSAIGSLSNLFKSITTNFADVGNFRDIVKNLVGTGTKPEEMNGVLAYIGVLPGWFNHSFSTMILPEVSKNIADTAFNIENLSKIKESIDKIGDVTTTLTNAKDLNLLIPEVYTVMGSAATWFDPSILSVLTEDQVKGSTDGINRTFDVLLAFADSMDMVMQKVTTEKLDEFAGRTEAIIEHTRKMKDMLENLDTIPIDATIDQMGRNMKIAKKIMEINGGAVKVAVQVNLTMNAEKMAAGLVANGYIEPTQQFGEYMQNNDGIGEQFKNPSVKYESRTDNAQWRSTNSDLLDRR
jgi:hypothetical protein